MSTLAESNYPDMPEIEITLNGVVSLLHKLKPFKACGSDQIPNCILKEVAREIAPALSLLYQSSFRQAKLPDEWKHAYVTPIFKEGDRFTASNYRPVSLTCVCCKMLEHICIHPLWHTLIVIRYYLSSSMVFVSNVLVKHSYC